MHRRRYTNGLPTPTTPIGIAADRFW